MQVARVKAPGGEGKLVIEETVRPEPGPGEILVRIYASSLNYHDYLVVMGMIPSDDGRIPMSDGAGEVEAVGPGVTRFKPGDKVMSLFFTEWKSGPMKHAGFETVPGDGIDGFAAEYVAMPETWFTRMPGAYSYAEAATLPCAALTAWRAMFVEGNVQPGDWVLVQGSGGVSIFALQFAKASGARVVATSSSDAKLEKLRALGADHLINYKTTPEWGAKAKELTGGIDEVIEIGGPGTLPQSIEACKIGGHISLIGVLTGFAGEVPTMAFMGANLRMSGITVGSADDQEHMLSALEANDIKPVISDSFPLAKIAEAFAHQAAQNHFGKIVLEI